MTGTEALPPEVLRSIRILFFEECEELLGEIEAGLLSLQRDGGQEAINSVFRAIHSIKGSAGAFDLPGLVGFAHRFETVLAALRAGRLEPDPALVKVLLRAADVLADMVRAGQEERELEPGYGADAVQGLNAFIGPDTETEDDFGFVPRPVALEEPEPEPGLASGGRAERDWIIRIRPENELYAKAGEPLLLLRELRALGSAIAVQLNDEQMPLLAELEPEKAYLSWTVQLRTSASEAEIREVFAFVDCDCELHIHEAKPGAAPKVEAAAPQILAAPAAPAPPSQSIRVDLERVDRLINLVGELLINQAILSQRLQEAGLTSVGGHELPLQELNRLTRDTQDSVMAIRAQPVKGVLQRMSRLVRELEAATGKAVDLVISGEATEVDRTVIEHLTDPLAHMIRNAMDHGFEEPAQRLKAGKPPRGTLRVSASHRAGRILIEVADDGGGIDRERVRTVAIERRLIAPDAILTDDEIDNLIFHPGFSTAAKASDLSGRGVGMDVVKSGVEALGGRIDVFSRHGEGSTFTLSLPLTLAVLDGMVVAVGDSVFVAPLSTLVEAIQPGPGDIRRLGPDIELLRFRGEHLPLINLAALFRHEIQTREIGRTVVLVVENDRGERAALLVDTILGQRQVVVRSLEANYRAIDGVASATILGDGRVALILDVTGILATHRRETAPIERRIAAAG